MKNFTINTYEQILAVCKEKRKFNKKAIFEGMGGRINWQTINDVLSYAEKEDKIKIVIISDKNVYVWVGD